jgi:catabolite regulation protein CreA
MIAESNEQEQSCEKTISHSAQSGPIKIQSSKQHDGKNMNNRTKPQVFNGSLHQDFFDNKRTVLWGKR